MRYVRFGRTGMKVSAICLGCMSFGNGSPWMVDGDDARRVLRRAWDLGITYFDTANSYSEGRSEEIVGEFLREVGRDQAVLATKVYFPTGKGPNDGGLSRKHVLAQVTASLRRLKTDYLDLYQTHRWDYDTPIDETLSVLTDLVRDGRVRYLGASSMWAWQFARALAVSERNGYERFASMQNLYNLLYREEEREMIPLCRSENIALIPWSPTAGGFLSGKYFLDGKIATTEADHRRVVPGSVGYRRYVRSDSHEVVRRLRELAERKGVTPTQVALQWLLTKGVTAPIVGTSKVEHLEEMVGALDVTLSPEDATYLEAPYVPQPVAVDSWH
jgi:aryl-alcohol dehydrogenase-like predicted oxidoreductase